MSTENQYTELIQVAAVAVANAEILRFGQSDAARPIVLASLRSQVDRVLDEVRVERYRQDALWGIQGGDPFERLMILMEEVGEVAEEIELGDPKLPDNFPPAFLLESVVRLGRQAKRWLEGPRGE